MARSLYLGNHSDAPGRGIGHDPHHVGGGVAAGLPALDIVAPIQAPSPKPGQLGQARQVDPPGLVVGEVPVKDVEAVEGRQVEEALDKLRLKDVARRIQQKAPPGKAGRVLDAAGGDSRKALARGGDCGEDKLA